MLSRAVELLLIALLVVVSFGVAFQFQNQQLLRELLNEVRDRLPRQTVAQSNPPEGEHLRAGDETRENRSGSGSGAASGSQASGHSGGQSNSANALAGGASGSEQGGASDSGASQQDSDGGDGSADGTSDGSSSGASGSSGDQASGSGDGSESGSSGEPAGSQANGESGSSESSSSGSQQSDGLSKQEQQQAEAEWKEHGELIKQIIRDMLAGEYEAVVDRFDADMTANLPLEQLAGAIDPVREEYGGLKRFVEHRPTPEKIAEDMISFEVIVELEQGHRMLFTVTLDGQEQISGLLMKDYKPGANDQAAAKQAAKSGESN